MTNSDHPSAAIVPARPFIAKALGNIAQSEADTQVIEEIWSPWINGGQAYFDLVLKADREITIGLWAFYLQVIIYYWNRGTKPVAAHLHRIRQAYPSRGDLRANDLLDGAAIALQRLAEFEEAASEIQVRDLSVGLVKSLRELAVAAEIVGDNDVAYDLIAVCLDVPCDDIALLEGTAKDGIRLATDARRLHQIAFCKAALARAIAPEADRQPHRRVEVFENCEAAIELLFQTSGKTRTAGAHLVGTVVSGRDYLERLVPQLWFLLPEEERQPQMSIERAPQWPDRVSNKTWEVWCRGLSNILDAFSWDAERETARLSLKPPHFAATAQTDWTTWTLDHPAYRSAVPHHHSLERLTSMATYWC